MDNDAIRLRSEISRISLEINQQITAIGLAKLELRAAGEDMLQLRSGRNDVDSAAGIMLNGVVPDLDATLGQLVSIRRVLEDWLPLI